MRSRLVAQANLEALLYEVTNLSSAKRVIRTTEWQLPTYPCMLMHQSDKLKIWILWINKHQRVNGTNQSNLLLVHLLLAISLCYLLMTH